MILNVTFDAISLSPCSLSITSVSTKLPPSEEAVRFIWTLPGIYKRESSPANAE